MKVTAHFTAEEFGQPARHGGTRAPYPSRWIAGRLRPLCATLEVLRAADLRVSGVTPAKVHAVALELQREGKIRIGGFGKYPGFVHVDVRLGKRLARWAGSRRET